MLLLIYITYLPIFYRSRLDICKAYTNYTRTIICTGIEVYKLYTEYMKVGNYCPSANLIIYTLHNYADSGYSIHRFYPLQSLLTFY